MTKKDVFEWLLRDHHIAAVMLNTKVPGVILPQALLAERTVALYFGNNLPVKIDDLVTSDSGLSATLSFGGTFAKVSVPWLAVFAMSGVESGAEIPSVEVVWPPDFPRDAAGAGPPATPEQPTGRSHLKSV